LQGGVNGTLLQDFAGCVKLQFLAKMESFQRNNKNIILRGVKNSTLLYTINLTVVLWYFLLQSNYCDNDKRQAILI
jgi:hypothetical protein